MITVDSSRAKDVNPWKTAILFCMASYLDAGALTGISTALVLYTRDLGVTTQDIGSISGLLTALFAIGALIGGHLGDRYGRRRVFRVSLLMFLVGCMLLAGATERWMLYVGAALVGISVGADIPVSLAMVAEAAPENQRGRMLTLATLLWTFGIGSTAILTTLFAKHGALGGRIILAHLAVVAAVVIVWRSAIPESKLWLEARSKAPRKNVLADWREIARPPVLGSLLALGLFFTFLNLPANTMGQFGALVYSELLHIPLETYATIGLISLPITALTLVWFMKVVDGLHRSRWFLAGAIAWVAAAAVPWLFGARLETLIVSNALGMFGAQFAGEGVFRILSQELVPTTLRGTTQGLTIAFGRFVAAAFAVATPSLLTFGADALFGVLTAFSAISSLILCLWLPRRPRLGFAGRPE